MHPLRSAARALAAVGLIAALACSQPDPLAQRSFESPEAAADALMQALSADDADAVVSILGPAFRDEIVTPDWKAGREARQVIVAAHGEQRRLEEREGGDVELVLGGEAWPFPFPLARDEEGAWTFDTAEGLEVVRDRRVGRNELTAIAITNAYVDAQIEYAKADRDGDDVLEYARRLASTEGQRDGLYWETAEDEEPSPFGPLVKGAESYLDTLEPGDPIRGYYFRILEAQGGSPPGGAYDYVINGNMIAGFALVAYPARYGSSGIMTFVVNHRGVIHQKDLGPFTGMDRYDPDDTWDEVDPTLEP